MKAPMAFFYQNPAGSGYVEIGSSRQTTIDAPDGLTETVARKAMAAYANQVIPQQWNSLEPYDPAKLVVKGWFGDLGILYVDGNGVPKEPTPIADKTAPPGQDWVLRGLTEEDMGALSLLIQLRVEQAEPWESAAWQRRFAAFQRAMEEQAETE